jgi:hypothetical protein
MSLRKAIFTGKTITNCPDRLLFIFKLKTFSGNGLKIPFTIAFSYYQKRCTEQKPFHSLLILIFFRIVNNFVIFSFLFMPLRFIKNPGCPYTRDLKNDYSYAER